MSDEHSVENIGEIRWKLCLCLLLAWVLVVLFVSKGIQSTGKVRVAEEGGIIQSTGKRTFERSRKSSLWFIAIV